MNNLSNIIVISTQNFEIEAMMVEEERPETCKKIWNSLSLEGKSSIYKEGACFEIPVELELENGIKSIKKGDIAYWPEGPAFCTFFGKSRPTNSVNTFARINESINLLKEVGPGKLIRISKKSEIKGNRSQLLKKIDRSPHSF